MKCLVKRKAILNFPDGRQVEITPGVHDHPIEVTKHWAFATYADCLDAEPEPEPDQKGKASDKK